MSFSYNPYEHIELVRTDTGGVRVYCHGCGGERPRPEEPALPPHVTLYEVFQIAADHVFTSHNRVPAEFAGWSRY